MNSSNKTPIVVVGLALFSMFFGSGNLIFPLFVGKYTQDQCAFGLLGFILTGVLFPFLAIIAMVTLRGDCLKFFSSLGRELGFAVQFLLLTVWIPFGSAPRCVALAYASLLPYVSMPPVWVFSIFYCVLIWAILAKRGRMYDVLGYVLTPILLVFLAAIICCGLYFSPPAAASTVSSTHAFYTGLKEGYNTMDMIAAFFFSASIISMMLQGMNEKGALKRSMQSCLIGIMILGVVYVGLVVLAAKHAVGLEGVPKEQLLAVISKVVLGPNLGVITALVVFIACFTTSVALAAVYYDYLKKRLPVKPESHYPMALTLLVTFVMSIFGLEGITGLTSPVLQVCYPLLAVLICIRMARYFYKRSQAEESDSAEEAPELN